jgi:hypothetical protein
MRKGGLALVAFVLVGAVTRVWVPHAQPTELSQQTASAAGKTTQETGSSAEPSATPGESFGTRIQEKIRTFFAEPTGAQGACADQAFYCVPAGSRAGIRFVIATVPDPIHTHLAHFFDTSIDAIEQGAFNDGYLFDSAVMPWPYTASPAETTAAIAEIRVVRIGQGARSVALTGKPSNGEIPPDSLPGLMIFRESEVRLDDGAGGAKADPRADPLARPLFVFVVGEMPTAGINEDQFRSAVEIIHRIRQGTDRLDAGDEPDFGIVGPTFSGSLYSLRGILERYLARYPDGYQSRPNRILPVYGTVLGTNTIGWFQQTIPPHVRLVLFQQDSETVLKGLFGFVNGLSYGNASVAVLSEDETAYGGTNLPNPTPPKTGPAASVALAEQKEFNLLFPRGISQFRSEYTKEILGAASGTQNGNQPPDLPLDLTATGSDDDSVAPYARPQTATTQEAIMLGIVSELRQHEAKFVVLRATDPLDELFLARYLHDKYSQGRVVVPTPDLLLAREGDPPLDGVLGLSTYPLTPSLPHSLNPLCPGFGGEETFFDAHGIAEFNATTALIRRLGELRGDSTDVRLSGRDRRASLAPAGPMDSSACVLSPNLWLTVVSRNAIRPVKVLDVEDSASGSPVFAKGTKAGREDSQRDARVPLWIIVYLICIAAMIRHLWLSWTGGEFGMWMTEGQLEPSGKSLRSKACLLCFGGLVLAAIFTVMVAVWISVFRPGSEMWAWSPLAVFAALTAWDFWCRRRESMLAVVFAGTVLALSWLALWYVRAVTEGMVLWQQRTLDLASGVSPATALLFLLMAIYWWFWYAFRAEGLVDWRCPKLPGRRELPDEFYNLTDEVAEHCRQVVRGLLTPWWVPLASVVAVLCVAVPAAMVTPGHSPVRSLEGLSFDFGYSTLLGVAIVLLLASLFRLIAAWGSFYGLLRPMDRDGLRDALKRLSGFEWSVIWNPASSVANEGYKILFREIQALERLQESLGQQASPEPANVGELRRLITLILEKRKKLIGLSEHHAAETPGNTRQFVEPYRELLALFATAAGFLCRSFLVDYWKQPASRDEKDPSDDSQGDASSASVSLASARASISIGVAARLTSDRPGLSPASLRIAGDFVASVYANFLVTILLGIRGLVFTVVAVYACIVLSTVSYPFEPAPDLAALSAVLFVFSGYAIWYVYEEMHRNATLSRMTSTEPGKLDAAFWTKFLSAGVVPLIALITAVYPPFGHLLYTLVGPLLQALR